MISLIQRMFLLHHEENLSREFFETISFILERDSYNMYRTYFIEYVVVYLGKSSLESGEWVWRYIYLVAFKSFLSSIYGTR